MGTSNPSVGASASGLGEGGVKAQVPEGRPIQPDVSSRSPPTTVTSTIVAQECIPRVMISSVNAVVCPTCHGPYIPGESVCRVCGKTVSRESRAFDGKSAARRILLLGAVAIAAIAIGALAYSNLMLVRSNAFQTALTAVFSSPQIQSEIGTGIQAKYPALGHLMSFGDSEFAEWSIAVTGSHGSGRLYGVANQINGVWDFSRVTFKSDHNGASLDLTPVRRLLLPEVPTQIVYLAPIGLDPAESLSWAPGHYKAKLGIDVVVLPPTPWETRLVDAERRQLNADKAVDLLKRRFPDIAKDPFNILIGVTSADMYIPGLDWQYAENMRDEGRFAIVSSARFHPLLEKLNPDWLSSRLQKQLTKNIVMLYFGLPMSSDYTSLLSGGVVSGLEIDRMSGRIIGSEGRWDPFIDEGGPEMTIYDVPGKGLLWRRESMRELPDTSMQVFSLSLNGGVLVQSKTDFLFQDDPALPFSRTYRNQDERSRAFGVGGSHPFDMFLGGQMGVAIDLITEEGARVHFVRESPGAGQRGDIYRAEDKGDERFVGTVAVLSGDTWQIKSNEGWTYLFPYRPQALPQYVTVLTSFLDPSQRKYEMERDSFGSLLKITSPSGNWLCFENDDKHRIRRIVASSGGTMQYDYDQGGHMIRASASDGRIDTYTYDDKGQMLTAAHGNEKPFLTNEYFNDGYAKSQTLGDGRRFDYSYFREGNEIRENEIVYPNGLKTYVQYIPGGYFESLPSSVPGHTMSKASN